MIRMVSNPERKQIYSDNLAEMSIFVTEFVAKEGFDTWMNTDWIKPVNKNGKMFYYIDLYGKYYDRVSDGFVSKINALLKIKNPL